MQVLGQDGGAEYDWEEDTGVEECNSCIPKCKMETNADYVFCRYSYCATECGPANEGKPKPSPKPKPAAAGGPGAAPGNAPAAGGR